MKETSKKVLGLVTAEAIAMKNPSHKEIAIDGCMYTYTGLLFDLLHPDKNLIRIEDIAHGLAFTCRWNGSTKSYFSVAEHCCRMYDALSGRLVNQKIALFHDAEEAYWGDIIRPIKKYLPQHILDKILLLRQMIFLRYDVRPINSLVDELDNQQMEWDFNNLIVKNNHTGWSCYRAEQEFLKRAYTVIEDDVI